MQQFLTAITMNKKRIKNLKEKDSKKDERFIDAGANFCKYNNYFNIFWLGNL